MSLKKISLGALMLVLGGAAYGASIDHIQNYTPEYNANPAQQGAINAGTSAYYNPAGLMHIENGTYFQVGAQAAMGKEEMKYDGETYDSDLMDVIPNISVVHKNDNRAWYWTFGGLAGGGELEYKDGVAGVALIEDQLKPGVGAAASAAATAKFYQGGFNAAKDQGATDAQANLAGLKAVSDNKATIDAIGKNASDNTNVTDQYAEGSNKYIQSTLGRAWFLTEKLSMSAAGRVVYGSRELKGDIKGELAGSPLEANIDSERTAWGYGGVFGLNYRATERLNLGMRYDTKINMNFEADASEKQVEIPVPGQDPMKIGFSSIYGQYADGVKSRRDLPAILALGASYKVTDRWTTFAGGNYYFNKDAKMDDDYTHGEYDNGWEVSLGSEYWVSSKVAWMLGANYAVTGADEETYSDIEYALDSFMLGTGIKYRQDENTEWVVAVSHYWYDSADGTHYSKEYGMDNARYDKQITAVGVSLTKRFN